MHRLPRLHRFRPRLLDALSGYDGRRLAADRWHSCWPA
jgi:hypothetical protein